MEKSFPVVSRIEKEIERIRIEIKRIGIEIREIKENMENMATKEDVKELRKRIDEMEDDFRRKYRSLRSRISELENNYEGIVIGAKVGARIGSNPKRLNPPMTFVEDSPFCDEYRIATYRENTGLLWDLENLETSLKEVSFFIVVNNSYMQNKIALFIVLYIIF